MRCRIGRRAQRPASERNVVVRTAAEIARDRVVGLGRDRRLVAAHPAAFTTAAAEHLDVARHDLGREALLSLLVLPLASADAALDVDLPALGEVLPADLRLLAPHHDAVPLGGFLLLTTL